MEPASIAMMLASMAVQKIAADNASDERRSKLNQSEAFARQKAKKNEAATQGYMNTVTPEARSAENAQANTDITNSLTNTPGAALASVPNAPVAGKGLNDPTGDYSSAKGVENARVKSVIDRVIGQKAVMGQDAERSRKTGYRATDTAGGINANNAAINNVTGAYNSEIANIRPNQMMGFLSQALSGAAGAMGGGTVNPTGGSNPEEIAQLMSMGGNPQDLPAIARRQKLFGIFGRG